MSATLKITLAARDQMSKVLGRASKSSNLLTRSFSKMAVIGGTVAGAFGGMKLAESFLEANSSLEQMKLRLEALTGSAKTAEDSFDFIKKFQEKFPVRDIQTITESYIDLVAAGINPTTGALQQLTAGAVKFGLTAADIKGVTRAFKQMTALTNAQKQELNQLVERIPGLTKIVSEEMGKTQEELLNGMRRMEIDSKELSAAVLRSIGKDSEEILRRFGNTWQAKTAQIKTAWFNLMTEVGKTGAFDAVKNAVQLMADFIGQNINSVVSAWSQAEAILGTIFDGLSVSLANAFGDAKVLKSLEAIMDALNNGIAWAKLIGINLEYGLKKAWNVMAKYLNGFESFRKKLYSLGIGSEFVDPEDAKRVAFLNKEIAGLQESVNSFYRVTDISDAGSSPFGSGIAKITRTLRDDIPRAEEAVGHLKNRIKELKKELSTKTNGERGLNLFDDPEEEYKKSTESLYKKQEDLQKKLEALREDHTKKAADAREAINREIVLNELKLAETIDSTHKASSKTFVGGWAKGVKEVGEKFKGLWTSVEEQGKFMAETVTRSMERSFSRFFDDLIDGKIVKLKDAILGFLKDIAKALSQALSNRLATQIIGGLATAFTPSGQQSGGGAATTNGLGGQPLAGFSGPQQKATRNKGGMKVEIINQSGEQVEAKSAQMSTDYGAQIMSIVIDSVRTNKGGSRTALKAGLT